MKDANMLWVMEVRHPDEDVWGTTDIVGPTRKFCVEQYQDAMATGRVLKRPDRRRWRVRFARYIREVKP